MKHLKFSVLFLLLGVILFSCDEDEDDDINVTDTYTAATDGLRISKSAVNFIPSSFSTDSRVTELNDLIDEVLAYNNDLKVPSSATKTDLTAVGRSMIEINPSFSEKHEWNTLGFSHELLFGERTASVKAKKVGDEYIWSYSKSADLVSERTSEYVDSYDVDAAQCKEGFCGYIEYNGDSAPYRYLGWGTYSSSDKRKSVDGDVKYIYIEDESNYYDIFLNSDNSGSAEKNGSTVLEWDSNGNEVILSE